ncbi:hypothetical protein DFH28DRAFT_420987 [Melampsora americana]|nr:hypothetical protein DFH28DRAFT_420987 [Melampsora americana]
MLDMSDSEHSDNQRHIKKFRKVSYLTPEEEEIYKTQFRSTKESRSKFDTFFRAKASQKTMEEHGEIFKDMETFWPGMESKMKTALSLFFPKTPEACESFAIWSAKNIIFPLFIHRISWIYDYFGRFKSKFPYQDLVSTLTSAKEYFQNWMIKESDEFVEGLLHHYKSKGTQYTLYKKRSSLYNQLKSNILYTCEFDRRTYNALQSYPWLLIEEWISKDLEFWNKQTQKIFANIKIVENKITVNEMVKYPNQYEFHSWNQWLDDLSYIRRWGKPRDDGIQLDVQPHILNSSSGL